MYIIDDHNQNSEGIRRDERLAASLLLKELFLSYSIMRFHVYRIGSKPIDTALCDGWL